MKLKALFPGFYYKRIKIKKAENQHMSYVVRLHFFHFFFFFNFNELYLSK